MQYCLTPIGVIHVSADDETVKKSLDGVPGIVEIFQEFAEGLRGIDGFSHLIIISYLHKTSDQHRQVLTVKPRRLIKLGLPPTEVPEVGVFCTDSPHRPNPIAITIVKLLKREGRYLHVEGVDLFNNTPVIDIRPYTPERKVGDIKLPEWYLNLLKTCRSLKN
ncbi:MAG: tRNA (N6-threonylcarbamoyladenosine(37)-N6)-methyltransferase TrmO [Sulfolobales archaeon]|nr:tRNA (N6-threonylcarbamoyladenosine(37)-N6)-methyltransferase TrmO [Sulfolobales archaeon]